MIQDKTNCSFESIKHTESTNLNIFRMTRSFSAILHFLKNHLKNMIQDSLKNMIQDKRNCSFEIIQHTESTNLNIFRMTRLFWAILHFFSLSSRL